MIEFTGSSAGEIRDIRIEDTVGKSSKDFVLGKVLVEGLLGDFFNDFSEQIETKIGVLILSADWINGFYESDVIYKLLFCVGKGPWVFVRQSCVMEEQVANGSVSLFVSVVIFYVFAHQVCQLN